MCWQMLSLMLPLMESQSYSATNRLTTDFAELQLIYIWVSKRLEVCKKAASVDTRTF